MIVRELLVRLGVTPTPEWKQVPQQIDNVKKAADGAAKAVRNIFAGFLTLKALESVIHIADEMQSLRARVAALPQTVGDASDAFHQVEQHALAAGAGIETYATLYARIGSAAKEVIPSQKQLLDTVDTISKAIATSGATATQQKSAFYQLSESFNLGKLQGVHLKALATDVPDFVHALGHAMGYTSEQFAKAATAGQITSAKLAKAIADVKTEFDDKFNKLPMTFSRAMQRIESRWAIFVDDLNDQSGFIPYIAKVFSDTFDEIFDGLHKLIESLGGSATAIKWFGVAIAAALAPTAVRYAIGLITFLASSTFLLFVALAAAIAIGWEFYAWVHGGKTVLNDWFGQWKSEKVQDFFRNAMFAAGAFFVFVIAGGTTVLVRTIATLSSMIAFEAWMWGERLLLGKIGWVNYLAQQALAAGVWITTSASMALASAGVTLPLWLIVAVIAAIIAAAYLLWKNWDSITKFMGDAATNIWNGILDGFHTMVDGLTSAWNSFKSFFGFGLSTTISANGAGPMPNQVDMGSGDGWGGAVGGDRLPGSSTSINITQELPEGSPKEVHDAARAGALAGFDAAGFGTIQDISGQMGQRQ